ncbi:MAG: CIA30 family protein [Flavobacteriia bacterium]|nr:CIA30 family protein [Flavobacteriia bacterium]OIP46707.1 MAG: CIA30 family protein [Flavobacteriaceae bacterium CG2_30_31_66]PIV95765.1 MAG: CIA30 family protein [Flavobacteriaceae bacterium CG17_big_fil_post_rev_8_21_14_2_50_31_13]PIX13557.1 MAG: CIA30 family protein [Flavobacteriaceae bacterium CG_4_8_14_3_um_filter_31_8]PIY16167.1 MAG: CIA30 family protein [Flavobacteriaceae bacterium CG_4_10_14_3_um_filter_31_253]PIZ11280.1 MAG: CIA30 family protein [Flavobacteriaceae bacterium CG_4_10
MIFKQLIFDFSKDTDISSWKVIDDAVMGGESSGNFTINTDGNAVFYGKVSLENNGGFSSLRHQFSQKSINYAAKIKVRLRGDGNNYQLRIKKSKNDYYSYVATFQTNNCWETIEINLSEMQPKFRGNVLSLPKFSSNSFEEIAFLIGNKKAQDFRLEIDKIYLQ